MRKLLVVAVAFAAALVGSIGSAQAQLDHTWVASNGLNSNPCSPSQPCADFLTAILKTNTNGEVGCVNSGQYGAVTITTAITIDCTGVQASVQVSAGQAITVNVPGGTKVVLRGLDIQGLNSGSFGIFLAQGGILHVEQCVIRAFTGHGMFLVPSNATELYVTDTSSIDNGGSGLVLTPSGGPVVNIVLDRVHMNRNNLDGITVTGNSGAKTHVQMTNSTVSGNTNFGVFVTTGAQPTTIMVASSLVSANNLTGVAAQGAAAAVILNGNTITNNVTAMSAGSGGAIFSYGNNAVNDNGSPGSAPTPVALR